MADRHIFMCTNDLNLSILHRNRLLIFVYCTSIFEAEEFSVNSSAFSLVTIRRRRLP